MPWCQRYMRSRSPNQAANAGSRTISNRLAATSPLPSQPYHAPAPASVIDVPGSAITAGTIEIAARRTTGGSGTLMQEKRRAP